MMDVRPALHASLLLAAAAAALTWTAPAEAHEIDIIEHLAGATNVQAIAGAGGLTLGVSRDGDVSVLTWPSPSYTDQLSYVTSNDLEARALPRFGASEGMGVFAGVVTSTDGGETVALSWLRTAPWSARVRYADSRSSVIVTTFVNDDLGLTVVQTDVVDEIDDVWARRFDVTRSGESPVTDAWILVYANLSPTLSRIPEAPLADWAADGRNDFAAVFDESARTITHFHPGDTGVMTGVGDLLVQARKDYGPIGAALMEAGAVDRETADGLAASLDDDFAPGVYLTLTTSPPPDGWQVGFDETDLCGPLDAVADNIAALPERFPGFDTGGLETFADLLRCFGGVHPGEAIREREAWQAEAADALGDALDGVLTGSRLAAGQVNEALRAPLVFDGDVASATFYLAAGDTATASREALEAVMATPSDALVAAVVEAHHAWIAPLALPEPPAEMDPARREWLRDFSARTLLNIRVGTDRVTGAIVASISRQPPYGQDWPRDGAFFNQALDVAGLHDLVTGRARFYASVQRDEPIEPTDLVDAPVPGWPDDPDNEMYPADSWEMNYYADGLVSGHIRFEIDNTALLVWSFVCHAGYFPDETERLAYLEEMYPTIRRAADLLVFWRDEATYLHWPANEDDNVGFQQGLQGAGTVFGALRAAAMAARALGHDDDAERYELRAAEVRWAILHFLYEEDQGFIEQVTENPGSAGTGASSWLAWPVRLLDEDDPRILAQLESNLAIVRSQLSPETEGGAYLTKATLAIALTHPDAAIRQQALEVAMDMVFEVADPDTLYLGEVFAPIDDDGDGLADDFDNRVSTPHLWAATLVYLTLMASFHPERFDLHEELLPAAQIPDEVAPPPPSEEAGPDGGADASPDGGADASPDAAAPTNAAGGACQCRSAASRASLSLASRLLTMP